MFSGIHLVYCTGFSLYDRSDFYSMESSVSDGAGTIQREQWRSAGGDDILVSVVHTAGFFYIDDGETQEHGTASWIRHLCSACGICFGEIPDVDFGAVFVARYLWNHGIYGGAKATQRDTRDIMYIFCRRIVLCVSVYHGRI